MVRFSVMVTSRCRLLLCLVLWLGIGYGVRGPFKC